MDEFRREVDEVDSQIIKLLEKRSEMSKQIGAYKKQNNIEIIDKKRERELIENLQNTSSLDKNFIKELYNLIIRNSREIQRNQ
jgi:monofunctional chorismate mutase